MNTIKMIYKQYHQDIYFYLISLTNDPSLSEDLVSETFLAAIKGLPRFKGESTIKTWLFSIARYKWYEYLRKAKETISLDELTQHYLSPENTPEVLAIQQSIYQRILALLADEPERTRDIVLRRIEGYSYYEIATLHSISENSARVIDYRAKQKIKRALEKENMTYE